MKIEIGDIGFLERIKKIYFFSFLGQNQVNIYSWLLWMGGVNKEDMDTDFVFIDFCFINNSFQVQGDDS